jgi:hypothetical protein
MKALNGGATNRKARQRRENRRRTRAEKELAALKVILMLRCARMFASGVRLPFSKSTITFRETTAFRLRAFGV